MKKIIKTQSPIDFEEWKNKNLKNDYEDILEELEKEVLKKKKFDKKKLLKKLKGSEKWDDLCGEEKIILRKSLLEEQGYICAYCGKRIENEKKTIIEHISPKTKYKRHQFDYNNLVVSCNGNELSSGKSSKKLHCDKKKGDQEIEVNPVHDYREWEENLMYGLDGKVYTKLKNEKYQDLIEILNLNNKVLIRKRKSALKGFVCTPKKLQNGRIKLVQNKLEINEIKKLSFALKENKINGKYFPYCLAVASMLDLEEVKLKNIWLKEKLKNIRDKMVKEGINENLICKILGSDK